MRNGVGSRGSRSHGATGKFALTQHIFSHLTLPSPAARTRGSNPLLSFTLHVHGHLHPILNIFVFSWCGESVECVQCVRWCDALGCFWKQAVLLLEMCGACNTTPRAKSAAKTAQRPS